MYNNKEFAPGIRQYVIEYIQNLNKILADLKWVGVTIARVKSQFCQAYIKIVKFICDADGCHLDISKVLKILNWLECTNTTLAQVFLGVYIYYRIWMRNFA